MIQSNLKRDQSMSPTPPEIQISMKSWVGIKESTCTKNSSKLVNKKLKTSSKLFQKTIVKSDLAISVKDLWKIKNLRDMIGRLRSKI